MWIVYLTNCVFFTIMASKADGERFFSAIFRHGLGLLRHSIQCQVCSAAWVNKQRWKPNDRFTLFITFSLKWRQHMGRTIDQSGIKKPLKSLWVKWLIVLYNTVYIQHFKVIELFSVLNLTSYSNNFKFILAFNSIYTVYA